MTEHDPMYTHWNITQTCTCSGWTWREKAQDVLGIKGLFILGSRGAAVHAPWHHSSGVGAWPAVQSDGRQTQPCHLTGAEWISADSRAGACRARGLHRQCGVTLREINQLSVCVCVCCSDWVSATSLNAGLGSEGGETDPHDGLAAALGAAPPRHLPERSAAGDRQVPPSAAPHSATACVTATDTCTRSSTCKHRLPRTQGLGLLYGQPEVRNVMEDPDSRG